MRRLAFVLALLAAACGGVDFTGSYSGSTTFQVTCPGSAPESRVEDASLSITDDANGLRAHITCGYLNLTANGNTATLAEPKTCPPVTSNGVQGTTTFKTGTFALSGSSLAITLNSDLVLSSNGQSTTCAAVQTGTLVRAP